MNKPYKKHSLNWIGGAVLFGIVAASATTSRASEPVVSEEKVKLSMRCHELIRGTPDPDGVVYLLRGKTLYRDTIPISTEEGITLSSIHGDVRSASHRVEGSTLTRTLYSQTGTQPKRIIGVEAFDFKQQRIIDAGEDTCHHNVDLQLPDKHQ